MPLTDQASMVDVEAMNRVLAGARIKRVLIGLQSGQPTLAVLTDRKMPDTGLDILLLVTGFIQCGVAGSIVHDATQEIPR
jgi:hypothetical protein